MRKRYTCSECGKRLNDKHVCMDTILGTDRVFCDPCHDDAVWEERLAMKADLAAKDAEIAEISRANEILIDMFTSFICQERYPYCGHEDCHGRDECIQKPPVGVIAGLQAVIEAVEA